MKQYVIGFGTGRSGSTSLSNLISGCTDCAVSREKNASFWGANWEFTKKHADRTFQFLQILKGSLIGDIAPYYLNYITYFINNIDNVKILYTYRDREETVNSFVNRFSYMDNFFKGKSKNWRKRLFPTINTASKRKAFEKYYDLYTDTAKTLIKKHNKKIKSIYVEDLNNLDKIKEIFDFLCIPENYRNYRIVKDN